MSNRVSLMPPHRLVQPIRILVTIGYLGCFHPISWDKDTGTPVVRCSEWRYLIWKMKAVLTNLTYIVSLPRFIILMLTDIKETDRILATSFFAYYCVGFVLEMISVTSSHAWCTHTNHILRFYELIQGALIGTSKQAVNPEDMQKLRLTESIGTWGLFVGVVDAGAVWLYTMAYSDTAPGSLKFLIFYAKTGNESTIFTDIFLYSVLCIWQLHVACSISVHGILMLLISSQDILLMTLVFERIRKLNTIFTEGNRLLYHSLNLLVREVSEVYGYGALGLENVTILMTIFGFYSLIRLQGLAGIMSALPAVNCYIIMVGLFYFMANYEKNARTALQQWKTQEFLAPKLIRKQLHACRFLRFTIAESFYVDKKFVLTVSKIVFDGCINVLIATKV